METNIDFWKFEDYKITDEQCLKVGENETPLELADSIITLAESARDKRNKGIIKKLEALTVKYPNALALKNYLVIAYKMRGENGKAKEINERLFAEHPNYLFSKISKAEEYLENGEPEKVREVLGDTLELKALYPDRDWFHISELTNFFSIVTSYYLAVGNLTAADIQIERLNKLCPEHRNLSFLSKKVLLARLEIYQKRMQESEEKRIKVISDKPTPKCNDTKFPFFYHTELIELYNYEYDIPQSLLADYLSLPRESLILDLETIIMDAVARNEFFVNNSSELSNYFPIHAIYLLSELKSENSLSVIFTILSYNSDFLDFWFGYELAEYLWKPIYILGKNNVDSLKEFILKPGIDYHTKMAVSEAVTQMYYHKDKSKIEVLGFYTEVFNGFLFANLNDNLIDSSLIGFLLCDCLDMNLIELLPLINQLFEKEYVNEMIVGSFEDVKSGFSNPSRIKDKKEVLDIYKEYQKLIGYSDENADWKKQRDELVKQYDDYEEVVSESRFTESTARPITVNKVGRNDPCPCGSGKKYKKCCMD